MEQIITDIGLAIILLESIAIKLTERKMSTYVTLATIFTSIIFFIH